MDDLITLRVPPTVPALAGYGDLDGPGTALPTLCAQTSTLKTQSAPPAAWVLSVSRVPSPASTHFLHNKQATFPSHTSASPTVQWAQGPPWASQST